MDGAQAPSPLKNNTQNSVQVPIDYIKTIIEGVSSQ